MSMAGYLIRGIAIFLMLGMARVTTAWAEAVEPRRCPGSSATVAASTPAEFAEICGAVQDAAAFFPDIGLTLPDNLFIIPTANWVGEDEFYRLAQYDCRTHAIRILHLDQAGTVPHLFSTPMTNRLWRSFISHEITHAAVHGRLHCALSELAATEYIAAVVQMGTLPAAEREAILAVYNSLDGFDRPEEISEIYYSLAPDKFAVNAWLHFTKPGNGAGFVRNLLQPEPAGNLVPTVQ